MKRKIAVYKLNEFNLVSFAISAMAGTKVYVSSVQPYIPLVHGMLRKMATFLHRHQLGRPAGELHPLFEHYDLNPFENQIAKLYPRWESDINDYYKFDSVGAKLGDYELIYKHAVLNHVKPLFRKIDIIHSLRQRIVTEDVRLKGLPNDQWDLFKIVFGKAPPNSRPRSKVPRLFFNLLSTIFVCSFSIGFVCWRTRFGKIATERFALGADIAEEGKVRNFFKKITDDPEHILFVCRNRSVRHSMDSSQLARYRHAEMTDGRYGFIESVEAMVFVARDCWKLFRHLHWLPSDIFYSVVKQVWKRAVFRGLFTRFWFGAFLARDEYNADHITRTLELRRAGIKSLGITHGVHAMPRVYPQFRYVDFDILYTISRCQVSAYQDTWPKKMICKPLGSFGLTREQFSRINQPRNRDIIIFANQLVDTDKLIESIRGIAHGFRDRTVFLKLKYFRVERTRSFYDIYMEKLDEFPPHVRIIDGDPYPLMLKAGYAFGGLTTAIIEFAQMGGIGFFVDGYDKDVDVVFRDFPEFCVEDDREAIEAIKEIETGNRQYQVSQFEELVVRPKEFNFDTMRRDIGLCPTRVRTY